MVKVGRKERRDDVYFSRTTIILVIALLLIPGIFTIYSIQFREKIRVGIVLTSHELYNDAEIVKEGLNQFHDIFSVQILSTTFNESNVRTKDGSFLTNDYFDGKFAQDARDTYKVDIILILTDKLINNWRGDRLARWGQADTRTAMTLITTAYKRDDPVMYERYLI